MLCKQNVLLCTEIIYNVAFAMFAFVSCSLATSTGYIRRFTEFRRYKNRVFYGYISNPNNQNVGSCNVINPNRKFIKLILRRVYLLGTQPQYM